MDEYEALMMRAADADRRAARCVSGSREEESFRQLAREWRSLARRGKARTGPPRSAGSTEEGA